MALNIRANASEYKPPTQAVPTLRNDPPEPPSVNPLRATSNNMDGITPAYQAGQPVPSPTQAATIAVHTQFTRSRSRWTSAARVSTTDKDSSPLDPPSSPPAQAQLGRSGSHAYSSYTDIYKTQVADQTTIASPAGFSGMAIDPSRLIRRKSFSRFMPKNNLIQRTTRATGREKERGGATNEGDRRLERGTGGVLMDRIGIQRARRQFRLPTVTRHQESGR